MQTALGECLVFAGRPRKDENQRWVSVGPASKTLAQLALTHVMLNGLLLFFVHSKLELLTHLPASNDEIQK